MVWFICVDMTTSETQDCFHLMRYIHIVYQCFTCLWTLPLRYFTGGRSVTSHLVWLSLNDWSLVYDSRMSCVWLTYALCMTHVWLVHDAGFDLPLFRPRGEFYIHLFVLVYYFSSLKNIVWFFCVDMTTSETQDCFHLMRYIHIVYQCFTCLWTLPLRYFTGGRSVTSHLVWLSLNDWILVLFFQHS